jgi:hypothetical protein
MPFLTRLRTWAAGDITGEEIVAQDCELGALGSFGILPHTVHFAAMQDGRVDIAVGELFSDSGVAELVGLIRSLGVRGAGQSSWGPTGFAFAYSEEIASRLYDSSIEVARAEGLDILIAAGRNTGASVERIAST